MQRVARALVIAAALALVAGECGGDEAEVACLEAVARLDSCCPTLDASVFACSGGGEGLRCAVVYGSPTIGVDESRCICARSCAELQDGGVCARAAALAPDGSGSPLCP